VTRGRLAPLLAIIIAAGAIVALSLSSEKPPPKIVKELTELPQVARVELSGGPGEELTIVHIRDFHLVPRETAKVEGLDYQEMVNTVEHVQNEEMAIVRFLARSYSVKELYSEGLSKDSMDGLTIRLNLLRDMEKLANAKKLNAEELKEGRELALTVGVPGRLYLLKEIDAVLPLEDEKALQEAHPVVNGKLAPDPAKIFLRRQAMMAQLPKKGIAVVILGGSHDLAPHLPPGTLYLRVTPKSYAE
jgi:hypothetical protein